MADTLSMLAAPSTIAAASTDAGVRWMPITPDSMTTILSVLDSDQAYEAVAASV